MNEWSIEISVFLVGVSRYINNWKSNNNNQIETNVAKLYFPKESPSCHNPYAAAKSPAFATESTITVKVLLRPKLTIIFLYASATSKYAIDALHD